MPTPETCRYRFQVQVALFHVSQVFVPVWQRISVMPSISFSGDVSGGAVERKAETTTRLKPSRRRINAHNDDAELYWLVLTTAMTGLLWVPYIVNRVMELGPPTAAWFPPPDPPPKAPWAGRAVRAHRNAVENLVIFAPLALAVHATGSGTQITATACMTYFFARAAHFVVCILGLPIIPRTIMFLIGVAAQMVLAATLLSTA